VPLPTRRLTGRPPSAKMGSLLFPTPGGRPMSRRCPHCDQALDTASSPPGPGAPCPRCRRDIRAGPAPGPGPCLAPAGTSDGRRRTGPHLPDTPEPAVATAPQGRPGPSVPGYEILGELGRGGMGVVYKARQVGLGRLVALKMIRGGAHAGPEELARFKAEAEAVARLQHPNIVQIFEVGELDGLPFFSLELVAGDNLGRWLAGAPQ